MSSAIRRASSAVVAKPCFVTGIPDLETTPRGRLNPTRASTPHRPHLQCDHNFDNLTQDSGRGQRFSSLQRPPELTETPEMDWPRPDQGAAMTPGRLGFRTSALALV